MGAQKASVGRDPLLHCDWNRMCECGVGSGVRLDLTGCACDCDDTEFVTLGDSA